MGWIGRLFGKKALSSANNHSGNSWTSLVQEPFPGAWQRNQELKREDVTSFFAVFACVSKIAQDVSKLPLQLKKLDQGIWVPTYEQRFNFLRKPNHFQTMQQFLESWITSKLLRGNTYALVQRDVFGRPEKYYVLNPDLVTPLVDDDGHVFYQLSNDKLSGVTKNVVVPASEIIHDRWNCFYHPLVGLPPVMACYVSASGGLAIQNSSSHFFNNRSLPSGILTAPGSISSEKAKDLKTRWNENYSGVNAGQTAVLGDDMKFQAITMSAAESQLIDQLKLSGEIVCSVFKVHPFMIGMGSLPTGMKASDLSELYYSGCLQGLIESIENLFDIHTDTARHKLSIEFDLNALIRMDGQAQMQILAEGVKGVIYSPNEARAKMGLKAVDGGDSPMIQQQNYSLAALAKRDAKEDPFANNPTKQTLSAEETKAVFADLMGLKDDT